MNPNLSLLLLLMIPQALLIGIQGQYLNVSILPVYDTPTDIILGEDEYRAASLLTLSCQVTGATGTVSYQWSSTCTGDCFFDASDSVHRTAQNISTSFRGNTSTMYTFFLRSTDAGIYTCEVIDDSGNTGSVSREVKIVGIGGYVQQNSGGARVLVNNDLVTPNTAESGFRLRIQCVSNSTTRDGNETDADTIGNVITPDGSAIEIGPINNNGQVRVGRHPYSRLGYLRLFNPQILHPIDSSRQGVYTCQVYDANDDLQPFNIGIYPNGFNTPPTIIGPLVYDLQQTVLKVTCTSTGSVATTVTWMKNNSPVIIDGRVSVLTQTVTDRAASTYNNVLTVNAEPNETIGAILYCCNVTNVIGSDQSCVEVTAIHIPDPGVPTVGETATLNCSSDFLGSMIEWVDSAGMVVAMTTTAQFLSLTFDPITDNLSNALYTCRATAANSVLYTNNITLSVEVPPDPISVSISSSGSGVAGSPYTLTCTVSEDITGLTGTPTAQWMVPSGLAEDIVEGNLSIGDQTSTLTLTFSPLLTSHGSDGYTCLGVLSSPAVKDGITATNSRTITVTIPQPTTDITADVKLPYIGTVYSLTCTIGVDPSVDTSVTVSAVWSQSTKGVELEDSNGCLDISDTTSTGSSTYETTLTFIPLLSNSTGQYFCDVTVVPSGSTYIIDTSNGGDYQLTVQDLPAPMIVYTTPGTPIIPGLPYTLTCIAKIAENVFGGDLTLKWLDGNGRIIPESSNVRVGSLTVTDNTVTLELTFTSFESRHVGDYTCHGCIEVPKASITSLCSSITVTANISGPCPTTVQDLLVHVQSDFRATITWREPAQPQGDIIGYEVDLKQYISGAQGVVTQSLDGFPLTTLETTLNQDTLMAGVPYEITVRASNIACYGESTSSEYFFTTEGVPAKVSDIAVARTSDTSVTVRWTRLTIVEARGVITGYIIEYKTADQKKRQTQQVDAGPDESVAIILNLEPSVAYTVTVYATSDGGQSASDPIAVAPGIQSPSGSSSIVGAVVAAVVVIIGTLVAITVIVWLILSHKRAVLSLQKGTSAEAHWNEVPLSGDHDPRMISVSGCSAYGALPAPQQNVEDTDHEYEVISHPNGSPPSSTSS